MLSMKETTVKIIQFFLIYKIFHIIEEDKMRLIKLKEINKKELNKIRLFKTIH